MIMMVVSRIGSLRGTSFIPYSCLAHHVQVSGAIGHDTPDVRRKRDASARRQLIRQSSGEAPSFLQISSSHSSGVRKRWRYSGPTRVDG